MAKIRKPHLALDGYKCGHKDQYPEGTQYIYSNLTARSFKHFNHSGLFDGKAVFVGLQGFVQSYLIEEWNEGFFNRPKDVVVAEYKRRMDAYLGPDAINVDHIAALHDLGYLPLLIKALPEGSRVPAKVPFLTIQNTHPAFFWLTNYIETVLSAELWKPITVATIAYEYRRILNKYVEETGANIQFADWQLHDFSMRGMSGRDDSAKCGAAHLYGTQGFGTDTLPALDYLEDYYYADVTKELVGGSVAATEHSVMCAGGMGEAELETFRRLIKKVYPSGIVSIVSDTWDFWKVITVYARMLKYEILSRTPDALGNAKVVFRPDSGDPVKIVAGYTYKEATNADLHSHIFYSDLDDVELLKVDGKYFKYKVYYDQWPGESIFNRIDLREEVPEHEVKGAVECLWDIFGGTTNENGFRTLNQRVGLIYGDSITLKRADEILSRLKDKGFAADNIVFGIGSYTYQYITRDTLGMAVKATYAVVKGEGRELFKDPATDNGVKKSARGLLRVEKDDTGNFVLFDQQTAFQELLGELIAVFKDGVNYSHDTYADIKERIKNS